jgi:glycosyltransferase involved in cell wall biosynthesis
LNEAKTIGRIVMDAARHGRPIVVDDGSSDDTAEAAAAAGADVVSHGKNRGYDAALNSGFARARDLDCEWVVTLDADGQHDVKLLDLFLGELGSGADVVVGIRDRQQRFAEALFARFGWWAWRLRDPLCGMKGYRMSVYRMHGCFDSCRSIGTELAISAAVRRLDVRQVPIQTRGRTDRARFGNIRGNIRILRALLIMAVKSLLLSRRRAAETRAS